MKKMSLLLVAALTALLAVTSGCGGLNRVSAPEVSPIDGTAPAAPAGLGVVLDENNARVLTWNPGAEPDLGSYQVYQYSPSPTRDNSFVLVSTCAAGSPRWPLPSVTSEWTTWFRVRAVDQAGNRSAESQPLAVTLFPYPMGGEPPIVNEEPRLP